MITFHDCETVMFSWVLERHDAFASSTDHPAIL